MTTKKAKVALVYPPFGPPNLPSLGLAILSAGLKKRGFSCDTHYWNYSFLQHLPGEELSAKQTTYRMLSIRDVFPWNEYPFMRCVLPEELSARDDEVDRMLAQLDEQYGHLFQESMPPGKLVKYLCERVDEILGAMGDGLEPYDVIGIGSTFYQNGPALALAWHVKNRWPEKTLILGGANCDDEMGAALLEKFPFLDFAFSGEVDHSFPEFIERLEVGASYDDVAGLCYRDTAGVVQLGPQQTPLQDLDSLPFPDFDDYLEQRMRYGFHNEGQIALPLESSRGCWWGAKQHCTFCGLNANGMAYRQKSQDRFKAEVAATVERYGTRFLFMTDNILSLGYFKDFIKWSAERDLGIDFFYEIKSNVKREQVAAMAAAGITLVQPGIESFSTSVLKLMRKGVAGIRNVAFLKHAEEYGLSVAYAILGGFPGEDPAEYERMSGSVQKLVHLSPPASVGPIEFHRFSPYHQNPNAFGIKLRPDPRYFYLYPFPEEDVARICYVFEPDVQPESKHLDQLEQVVMEWHRAYQSTGCTLTWSSTEDAIHVKDRRQGFPPTDYRITGFSRVIYGILDEPHTLKGMARQLSRGPATVSGVPIAPVSARRGGRAGLGEAVSPPGLAAESVEDCTDAAIATDTEPAAEIAHRHFHFSQEDYDRDPAATLAPLVEAGLIYEDDGCYVTLPVHEERVPKQEAWMRSGI